MKEEQPGIYYITGESVSTLNSSPYLEKLKSKGYEVLFLTDTIDEYVAQILNDYNDKKFICVTKDDLKLDSDKDDEKDNLLIIIDYEKQKTRIFLKGVIYGYFI